MDSKSRATDITIIEPALIEIRDGRVFSPRYEDIYYSRGGSVDSYRVFLEPAKLVERMGRGQVFTVVEFGFGTGLNFVVTATEFLRQRGKPTRLRFVSFEKHPLTLRDLKRIGQTWGKSLPFVDQLWNQYPPAVTGWHRRFFKGGNIELSLYVGEVATGLRNFIERDQGGVDAWFLDGFSPDRNPAMWQESLLSRLHTRTRAGGTVTTFSSAGS
ncbi:MAG: tRNA (5-methylaminomethyl-2-thiouridine)(34)-methyltransferase MnmD, partial [Pseudomonadota bacterium]|nr:tRNA (5-methylaminomethyl-2-thiouridine)(34)-methyltransferase MnmD [Pseudomonadota bacterium]